MQRELDYVGTPYTVVPDATGVSASMLADSATHGLFDGVIQSACDPSTDIGAANATGALSSYLATFHVRAACLYGRPDPAWGFGAATDADTHARSLSAAVHRSGQGRIWLVRERGAGDGERRGGGAREPLRCDDHLPCWSTAPVGPAWRFTASRTAASSCCSSFDQAPGALHSQQLMPGVASWLGRGVFIGEKRAFFGPQLDDVFLGTVMEDGTTFRMSGDDLRNVARWQQQVRATTLGAGMTLTLPFNGAEVTDTDDLTAAARAGGPAVRVAQPHLRPSPPRRGRLRADDIGAHQQRRGHDEVRLRPLRPRQPDHPRRERPGQRVGHAGGGGLRHPAGGL